MPFSLFWGNTEKCITKLEHNNYLILIENLHIVGSTDNFPFFSLILGIFPLLFTNYGVLLRNGQLKTIILNGQNVVSIQTVSNIQKKV